MRPSPKTKTVAGEGKESMTKETIVQTIGVLVAVATVAMTIAAVIHEFVAG